MTGQSMRVLAIIPSLMPSTHIGIGKPLSILAKSKKIRLNIKIGRETKLNHLNGADVIVFCRNTEYHDLELLYQSKRLGKTIIYEVDDNFPAMGIKTALGAYHSWQPRTWVLDEFFRVADIIHVYSKPMFERAIKHNSCVKLIKSYFDFDLISKLPKRQAVQSLPLKIAYQTSRGAADTMMKMFIEPLDRIISENPGQVEFHFWGKEMPPLMNRNAIKLHPFKSNYESFIKSAYQCHFDIGLAPIENDVFSQSKTNNKYREYGGMGVAGIYSKNPVYEECIIDGLTGIFVDDSSESWYLALQKLVEDSILRNNIQINAQKHVRENYSIENSIQTWNETLDLAPPKKYTFVPPLATPENARLRILIVHPEDLSIFNSWIRPLGDVVEFMKCEYTLSTTSRMQEALSSKAYEVLVVFSDSAKDIFDTTTFALHNFKKIYTVHINDYPEKNLLDTYNYSDKRSFMRKNITNEKYIHSIISLQNKVSHLLCLVSDDKLKNQYSNMAQILKEQFYVDKFSESASEQFWLEQLSRIIIRRDIKYSPQNIAKRLTNTKQKISQLFKWNRINPF